MKIRRFFNILSICLLLIFSFDSWSRPTTKIKFDPCKPSTWDKVDPDEEKTPDEYKDDCEGKVYKRRAQIAEKLRGNFEAKCRRKFPDKDGEDSTWDWVRGSPIRRYNAAQAAKRSTCQSKIIKKASEEAGRRILKEPVYKDYSKFDELKDKFLKRQRMSRERMENDVYISEVAEKKAEHEANKSYLKDMASLAGMASAATTGFGSYDSKSDFQIWCEGFGGKFIPDGKICYCEKWQVAFKEASRYNKERCEKGDAEVYRKYHRRLMCFDRGLLSLNEGERDNIKNILKIVKPGACESALPAKDVIKLTNQVSKAYDAYLEDETNSTFFNRKLKNITKRLGGKDGPERDAVVEAIGKSVMATIFDKKAEKLYLSALSDMAKDRADLYKLASPKIEAKLKDSNFINDFKKKHNIKGNLTAEQRAKAQNEILDNLKKNDPQIKKFMKDRKIDQKMSNLQKKSTALMKKAGVKGLYGGLHKSLLEKYSKPIDNLYKNNITYDSKKKTWKFPPNVGKLLTPENLKKNPSLRIGIGSAFGQNALNQLREYDPRRKPGEERPRRTSYTRLGNQFLTPAHDLKGRPTTPQIIPQKTQRNRMKALLESFMSAQARVKKAYHTCYGDNLQVGKSWNYLLCNVGKVFGKKCKAQPGQLNGSWLEIAENKLKLEKYRKWLRKSSVGRKGLKLLGLNDKYVSGATLCKRAIDWEEKFAHEKLTQIARVGGPRIAAALREIDMENTKDNAEKVDKFIGFVQNVQIGVAAAPAVPLLIAAAGPAAGLVGMSKAAGMSTAAFAAFTPLAFAAVKGILATYSTEETAGGPFWCHALNTVGDRMAGSLTSTAIAAAIPAALMGLSWLIPAVGAKVGLVATATGFQAAVATTYGALSVGSALAFLSYGAYKAIPGIAECKKQLEDVVNNPKMRSNEEEAKEYVFKLKKGQAFSKCSDEVLDAAMLAYASGKMAGQARMALIARKHGINLSKGTGKGSGHTHAGGKGGMDPSKVKVTRGLRKTFAARRRSYQRKVWRAENKIASIRTEMKKIAHRYKMAKKAQNFKLQKELLKQHQKLKSKLDPKRRFSPTRKLQNLKKYASKKGLKLRFRTNEQILRDTKRIHKRPYRPSSEAKKEIDKLYEDFKGKVKGFKPKPGEKVDKQVAILRGKIKGKEYNKVAVPGEKDPANFGKYKFAKNSKPGTEESFDTFYTRTGKPQKIVKGKVVAKARRLNATRKKWIRLAANQKKKFEHMEKLIQKGKAPKGAVTKKGGKLVPNERSDAYKNYFKAKVKAAKAEYRDWVTNPKHKLHNRNTDTEAKLLRDADRQLGGDRNATGEMTLISKKDLCASCWDVVKQFRTKYPKVELKIKYSEGAPAHAH